MIDGAIVRDRGARMASAPAIRLHVTRMKAILARTKHRFRQYEGAL